MKKTVRKLDSEGSKGLGFQYYLEQLHQLSEVQQTPVQRSVQQSKIAVPEEGIDEEQLILYVKLLKMCAETGEAYLEEALEKLDNDPQANYRALKRMASAGLLNISEGKVKLTPSGKELLQDL